MLDEADFPSLILSWGYHPFPDLGTLSSKKEVHEASSSHLVLGSTPVLNKPGVFLGQREGDPFIRSLELLITQAGDPRCLTEGQQSGLVELSTHELQKHLPDPSLPRADQALLLSSIQPMWWWGDPGRWCLQQQTRWRAGTRVQHRE